MVTIKNKQLTNETINQINELVEMDINASSAFKLARIVKDMSAIVEDRINAEKRIFSKYGEKDEDGNYIKVKDDNGNEVEDAIRITDVDAFNKEMTELMEVENTLPHDQIPFEELGLKTVKVKNIMNLDFLFV